MKLAAGIRRMDPGFMIFVRAWVCLQGNGIPCHVPPFILRSAPMLAKTGREADAMLEQSPAARCPRPLMSLHGIAIFDAKQPARWYGPAVLAVAWIWILDGSGKVYGKLLVVAHVDLTAAIDRRQGRVQNFPVEVFDRAVTADDEMDLRLVRVNQSIAK